MTDDGERTDAEVPIADAPPGGHEPLAFLRELVQNSLDAGSPEIDIRCVFEPPVGDDASADGVSILHVDDYGRGMDRQTIDDRFSRLFQSTSHEELVRLGQLGIGFVAVFALDPDAVAVDTFGGGERWRILISRGQPLQRIPLPDPGVGTQVRILRRATAAHHEAVVSRARQVLATWCRHCTAEIRFQGEPINEPLDVEALCQVRHAADDLEVVVGYPADGRPFYGFYRHGLTIHETRAGYWDDVVFKVDAAGLSRTLARDDVLRDDIYHRTLERMERLITDPLPAKLLARIEEKLLAGEHDATLDRFYEVGAEVVGRRQGRWPRSTDNRVIFHTVHGRPVTVRELQEAADKGRVYYDESPSPLTEALVDAGQLVVRAPEDSATLHALSSWLGTRPRPAHAWFCKPGPARTDEEATRWVPLRRAVWSLLAADDNRITEVEVAHFNPDGGDRPQRAAILQSVFGELTAYASVLPLAARPPGDPCVLAINADHPVVDELFGLAGAEPELAVGALLRLLGQQGLLDDALEDHFIRRVAQQRDERRGDVA